MSVSDDHKFAPEEYIDELGQTWSTYSVSYEYVGLRWGFHIKATGREDAEARVAAIANAKLDGKLVARVPDGEIEGYLARERAKLN